MHRVISPRARILILLPCELLSNSEIDRPTALCPIHLLIVVQRARTTRSDREIIRSLLARVQVGCPSCQYAAFGRVSARARILLFYRQVKSAFQGGTLQL